MKTICDYVFSDIITAAFSPSLQIIFSFFLIRPWSWNVWTEFWAFHFDLSYT